jgi:hypothetical protein
MTVYEGNKRKYIIKVLISITRHHYIKWLTASSIFNEYSFNVSDAVYQMGQLKMEQVKQYVFENAFLHKNLWFIYEEIKGFKEIADLLMYLSPRICYCPEVILLDILRSSRKIRIINTNNPGIYQIYPIYYDKLPSSREEMVRAIKIFIRSYVLLVFDIEKRPITLSELYQLFIREEKPYTSAREYKVIELLIKDKDYSIKDILLLIDSNGISTPEELFTDIVKHDYNHFFRMIDDYYGSKEWKEEERIRAYIKLYDIYAHSENPQKAAELGNIILENLNKSNLNERVQKSLRRIILRNKERVTYGV